MNAVFDDEAASGIDLELRGRMQKKVWVWFASFDMIGRVDVGSKQ